MLMSRSSLEKPNPFDRLVRTSSPSRTSILTPRARSSIASSVANVVLPAPDRPVNHTVKPFLLLNPFAPSIDPWSVVSGRQWSVAGLWSLVFDVWRSLSRSTKIDSSHRNQNQRPKSQTKDPQLTNDYCCCASISTWATSGRENSTGGNCPALNNSRTFVPDKVTCADVSCGHVLLEAIAAHVRQ